MALRIILQTINGKKIEDVVDWEYTLADLWPFGDQSYPLLQYLDPYGNTFFNGIQMPEVQKELDLLITRTVTEAQNDILRRIYGLTERCHKQPHTFLRFRGD